MNLIEALRWRYATKRFDPSKKIPEDVLDRLMEAVRLSASSYGLQAYRFVLVKNPELRAAMRPHCYNQPQITEASHLLVMCSLKEFGDANIQAYIDLAAKTQGKQVSDLDDYKNMITGDLMNRTPEQRSIWMGRQIYIALGTLLAACALEQVDATPMEGFVKDEVDQVLGLTETGLHAEVICAMGYRSSEDAYATTLKVRFPKKELFVVMD